MTPIKYAEKLAYVQPAPKTNNTARTLPMAPRNNFQHPPRIGQRKPGPITPPATADAKMVMRSAPSVPNPIVPPSQSSDPLPTQKVAAIKLAPRYSAGAKKGKKVMPQPHARQTKTAAAFGASMANGIEKKALGGIGTLIGAGAGAYSAPAGSKAEGLGRGVGKGLGWDVGGTMGGAAGAGLGGIAGGLSAPAITALLAILKGEEASPEAMAGSAGAGAVAGAGIGGAGGYFAGGELGRRTAGQMLGNPSWDNEDQQLASQQMAAP